MSEALEEGEDGPPLPLMRHLASGSRPPTAARSAFYVRRKEEGSR